MGREVRRVPLSWKHPATKCRHSPWAGGCSYAKMNGDGECPHPLFDHDIEAAERDYQKRPIPEDPEDDEGPPNPLYYRPAWTEAEATAYQMYETVSEGTPVSPVFATEAELVDYLVAKGDYSDQWNRRGGWKREIAERFVRNAWAPSAVSNGNGLMMPRDGA